MNINSKIKKETSEVINHIFFKKLNKGHYSKLELKFFAEQYFLISQAFVEFLLLGSVRIKKDIHRSVFIENLYDEHGKGRPENNHRNLLKKFLISLGDININNIKPVEKVSIYIHGMRDLCSYGSELEVIGALGPGCESVTVELYKLINNGIRDNFSATKQDLIFFSSHIAHDPKHSNDIDNIIKELAKDGNDLHAVVFGAKQSLILEKILWDGIFEGCEYLLKNRHKKIECNN
ncbi:MAG: iron-containing redox enzyme family protein [Gammaproteobacteria bacterium]|nr:iron-containing redox enzyme family protein [Gammaproteobacteria bacterium]